MLKGTSREEESEEGIRTSRIFIDQLLTMADTDGQLTDENICEQILTIIIAVRSSSQSPTHKPTTQSYHYTGQ